jgi:hypothetical protein
MEYTMSFINALASECIGRSYLLSKDDLVIQLIKVLKMEKSDTLLRQNVLGTLQKFSLRRRPQAIMIDNEVIHWISHTLRSVSKLRNTNRNNRSYVIIALNMQQHYL